MPITIKRRTFYLLVIMLLITLIVTGISIVILYNVVIDQRKERLQILCETQANIIKSLYKQTNHDEKKIIDILNAQFDYIGTINKSSEFVIARRKNDSIMFITRYRNFNFSHPQTIPFNSNHAIPMKYALEKNTGFVKGNDYSSTVVMAYCIYIPELKWGIVAKIDMSEVRAPFQKAALIAFLSALILAVAGAFLFRRISDPILKRIIRSEYQMSLVTDNIPTKIACIDKDMNFLFVNQEYADWRSKPKEEILGKKVAEIVRKEEYDIAYPNIRKVLSGEPVSFAT